MRSFRHINFEILKFFYTRRKCTLRARLENGEISGEKRHGHVITKYSGRTQYSRTQRAAICPNARVTNQAAAGNSGTCAKCKAVSTRSSSTLARNRYGFHTEKKSCASTVARPCLLADTWLSELNTPRNLTPRASIYNGLTTVSCKRLRNHCRTRDENSWLPSHPTHTNSHISSCPINPTRRTIML